MQDSQIKSPTILGHNMDETDTHDGHDSSKTTSRVPHFSGLQEEWATFKMRMTLYLEQHCLDEITFGDGTTSPDLTKGKNKELSKRARACILLGLPEDVVMMVFDHKNAFDVMQALCQHYENKARGNLIRALRQWWALRMDENESIQRWTARVQAAAKLVNTFNIPTCDMSGIQPQDIVNRILGGLTSDFDSILRTLDQTETEASMKDLTIAKLSSQAQNLESSNAARPETVLANSAMAIEVQALKAEILKLKAKPPSKSTCDIPYHRHRGGNDACWNLHPELRPSNKRVQPSIYSSQCALSAKRLASKIGEDIIADTGCSNHMFRDARCFSNYKLVQGPEITLGDNSTIKAVGIGDSKITLDGKTFLTKEVLHVPGLGKDLFSVGQSESTGIKYLLHDGQMTIYAKDHFEPPKGTVLAQIPRGKDNLYRLSSAATQAVISNPTCPNAPSANFTTQRGPVDRNIWHQRLGHINDKDLDRLISTQATGIVVKSTPARYDTSALCEPCVLAKMTRFPYSSSESKTSHPGELIMSDLKGPIPTAGIDGGWRYFVTYIDSHTRFTKLYLLKHKSDQLRAFKMYEATICNKFKTKIGSIEMFQSDNGGEYMSNDVKAYFEMQGIQHRTTVPYNPQSNGIAERLNRTIMETAESMRIQANLPRQFWSFFVFHAVYLLNRRPHAALTGKTPFEAFWGRKPRLSHLRIAGCDAWVLNPVVKRKAQDQHARRGIFVGYSPTQKAYRVWDPVKKSIMISQHVLFNETSFQIGRSQLNSPADNHEATVTLGSSVPDDDLHQIDSARQKSLQKSSIPSYTSNNYYKVLGESSGSEEDKDDSMQQTSDARNDNAEVELAQDEASDAEQHEPSPDFADDECRLTETSEEDENVDSFMPEVRRSDRVRKPPGQWWIPEPSGCAALTNEPCNVFDDSCNHLEYCALRAASKKVDKIQNSDSLPRPSLKGIRACDIKTDISLREALNGPYGGYFSDAAHKEFRNLVHFRTWALRDLPRSRKAIGSKWVFKVKANDDGSIEKFKARLVIQGFSQRPGIDYDETFAPVAHQESIRLLLALAAQHSYKLRHVDIVGAFLNGDVEEQVFMKQPEGFVESGQEHLVCELLKALYGLKQAGMVWNKRFNEFLVNKVGFRRVSADPCIYILKKQEQFIILGLHVDDTLMVHNNDELCNSIVRRMSTEFEITDLGEPKRLLGMRLRRSKDGTIRLDQEAYVHEILNRFNMNDCNPSSLPHQPGHHLSKTMCPQTPEEISDMKDVPYGELVGALLWLSICTRPDIKQAVSVLCRFVKNPGRAHWNAARLILRYLKGTSSFGIQFSKSESKGLIAHVDSDFANDPDKSRSVSAYIIQFANGPIAWKSKLQSTVATSSVHAEYIALYDGVREIVWLRQLLKDLDFDQKSPTVIFEDNKGCISLCSNERTDPRTKHINVKFHFNREQVKGKSIQVVYKPTAEMLADAMTKPICKPKFFHYRDQVGVRDFSGITNVLSGRRVENSVHDNTLGQ